MDKKPSSSKTSTSSKSQKRKADDKKETKKNTGQSSSKKPKQEVDMKFFIQAVKERTQAEHGKVEDEEHYRYVDVDECGKNTWKVEQQYKLKLLPTKCEKGRKCELYCEGCKVCKHQIKCDCKEKKYLCIHAHIIGTFLGFQTYQNFHDDDDDDEFDSEEEEKMDNIDATFSECKSLLNAKGTKEILQKNLDKALIQLQAHGQKLKKEEEKAAKKKK